MRLSRKVKLLTLIIMCSTIFFIYKKTNYNNITYTNIGDSLAVGIDSYGQKTYSYSEYVKEYLISKNKLKNYYNEFSNKNLTIKKLHYSLLTNEEVLCNNKKNNIKDILHETDYLTITIGLNDLIEKIDNKSEVNLDNIIKEINNSFNNLIKELRKVYNREIYIIGYYNQTINNKNYSLAIKKLNNIYKNHKEVTYISTEIISKNKNIFLSNPANYYPNYKGYKVISSKIIDKISKKLEK